MSFYNPRILADRYLLNVRSPKVKSRKVTWILFKVLAAAVAAAAVAAVEVVAVALAASALQLLQRLKQLMKGIKNAARLQCPVVVLST